MGTQVQCKSYLGGHKAMKDLNDDRNGNGWNLFYGEKNLGNGQYCTAFIQRTAADAHTGHGNHGLKRKMLEHDAIFKNQVYELHRLYRTQRDMMEDIKTKKGHRHEEPTESSSIKIFGHSYEANIWGKPTDSSSPNLTSFLSQNSSQGLNKTLQSPSGLNNEIWGEKWFANNISRSNPGRSRDPQSCNGFYHGSSSGSKDSPAFGFDHLICNRSDNTASSSLVHRMKKACMVSSCIDVKPQRDFNLNETFPRKAMNEVVPCQDLGIINGKSEDRKPLFPWLQTNPDNYLQAFKNEASNPDKNVIFIGETRKDLKGMIDITSSTNGFWPKNERYETQCVKKILGVPIFEKICATENDLSSLASFTPGRENTNEEKKNFLFDINVACDVEEVVKEKKLDKSGSARNFIDLNSYVTEDEDLEMPSGTSCVLPVRFVADFNLEEPAVPEEEDILSGKLDDEVLMSAAEAIVDISSCPDSAELESLLWFADVAFTADKLGNMSGKGCSSFKELDDFEAMILLLEDTKEEDYMPKPFVPDVMVKESGRNAPPTRPRRGQARRGRPQRDFKRDILPGLTTISKHDMTEDLQTFEDLMKATGHSWNPGSKRKNGGTRGRRRKAVELAPIETSLEDRRSLTSWGKTTRRPRRQRCPASNAPSVALI